MSKATDTPTPEFQPGTGYHRPFIWFREEVKQFPLADFAATTKDICGGLLLCLQLIEISNLCREDDTSQPMLGVGDTSSLMRFAISASALLEEEADRKIEWINDRSEEYLKDQAKKNR